MACNRDVFTFKLKYLVGTKYKVSCTFFYFLFFVIWFVRLLALRPLLAYCRALYCSLFVCRTDILAANMQSKSVHSIREFITRISCFDRDVMFVQQQYFENTLLLLWKKLRYGFNLSKTLAIAQYSDTFASYSTEKIIKYNRAN
jgi:hypothetical protein